MLYIRNMKNNLTIQTGERIFLIHYMWEMGRKDMCNLAQLKSLVTNSKGIEKIEHFIDYKFKKISKKDLKAMLQTHRLDSEFVDSY